MYTVLVVLLGGHLRTMKSHIRARRLVTRSLAFRNLVVL